MSTTLKIKTATGNPEMKMPQNYGKIKMPQSCGKLKMPQKILNQNATENFKMKMPQKNFKKKNIIPRRSSNETLKRFTNKGSNPSPLESPPGLPDLIIQAGLSDLIIQAGLPDLIIQAGLPDQIIQAGLPDLIIQAGLPDLIIQAGLPDLIIQAGLSLLIIQRGRPGRTGGSGEAAMKKIKFKKDSNGFAGLRKKLGFTQKQLAARLNVSRSLIAMVETGERNFPLDSLVKLSKLEVGMLAKQQAEDPKCNLQYTHSIYIQIISSH